MQIISGDLNFKIDDNTVVAIGKFDGVHKGHGMILKEMFKFRSKGYKTAILTFDVPPSTLFMGKDRNVITTNEEKRRIFDELHIDYLVEFPFNEQTASIPAERFVEKYLLECMNMKAVIVGNDCSFGYKGLGNCELLRRMGKISDFECVVLDKLIFDLDKECVIEDASLSNEDTQVEISSSIIRNIIEYGNIKRANAMLLYPYFFYGEVVHGRKIGRTLGMPTINLLPDINKLLPPSGVYFSSVFYMGCEYPSITNIGCKPTVSGNSDRPLMGVETYIYNFDGNLYGDYLRVNLYEFLREEHKFNSVEELKIQMAKDIERGRLWHRNCCDLL